MVKKKTENGTIVHEAIKRKKRTGKRKERKKEEGRDGMGWG